MLIVSSPKGVAAVGVGRVAGTGTLLVRRLPPLAPAGAVVSGATLDKYGNPRLFLDPEGLFQAASTGRRRLSPSAAPPAPVLVIDDSLTTRMVEQGILESAGYFVELATSAGEALEKAMSKRYSLFLVDVEMPGMNGFEFVARTRMDPVLREVPAILVTSLTSPEDRRRGEECGARAFIVKSEFDQSQFLQTIEELVR
jgi:two-component system chemotaxis sensor kinase CheA